MNSIWPRGQSVSSKHGCGALKEGFPLCSVERVLYNLILRQLVELSQKLQMPAAGGELDSTGLEEASVACPGSKAAWLKTLDYFLHANNNMAMAA